MKQPYIIVKEPLMSRLEQQVSELIRQGYEPTGGVLRHPPYFVQSLRWPYEKYTNRDLIR